MKDYSKGRIYRIDGGGLTYVGSTVSPLSVRMATHRSKAKCGGGCTSKKILCYYDAEITLVEMYPCDSQEELTKRERYWYDLIPCVNKNRPWVSAEELAEQIKSNGLAYRLANPEKTKAYRDAHLEKMRAYQAVYRANNKAKSKAYQATYQAAKKLKKSVDVSEELCNPKLTDEMKVKLAEKIEAEEVPEVPA